MPLVEYVSKNASYTYQANIAKKHAKDGKDKKAHHSVLSLCARQRIDATELKVTAYAKA